jgi:replicative DNA helicase
MPHIGRSQYDQGDEDDAGKRPELAGLRSKTAIDAADDLIGLRRVPDLILALPGCRALKI